MPGVTDVLREYRPDAPGADLYTGARPEVASKWSLMANGLAALCNDDWGRMHEQIARQIEDLGLAFRLTGDVDEREWPLNPMPLLIGADEWTALAEGLTQRAELLERVIDDIYGAQTLVRDGHLPASLIAGSRYFMRKMLNVPPPGGHHVHVYAVDLARGPTGEWRVLADRLRLPTGIGYALENRLALSRSTGSLLADVNSRRLAGFFAQLRAGIAADSPRDEPRIALLTPGRFNQSYPEQAHLARYLGFPLVEGRDLTVSQDKLYVRTIAGLKRIDALWRWIDTRLIDPLSFDSRSQIGVPDLFEACAKGGLTLANWLGTGVVEAGAFSAFLPRLCETVLGEPLRLPNIATWWCGQPQEAAHVHAHFDRMVIGAAFGGAVEGLPEGQSRIGATFTAAERTALFAAIERRPMDYIGREVVHLSTTPALVDNAFAPRPFTLRAFVARDGQGRWTVMPGGFARLSSSGTLRTSLMGDGDISADVCIVDARPVSQESLLGSRVTPSIRRSGGILSSQAADNLFWYSRYAERTETTVRIVRCLLGNSLEADGGGRDAAARERLVRLLAGWGAIAPGDMERPVTQICGRAFTDKTQPGAIATLIDTGRAIGRSLRDRIANDFWRVANRPAPSADPMQAESLMKAANQLIERFACQSGFATENMVRTPAWRFFEIGRRLERALNIASICLHFAGTTDSPDDLGIVLDLADSQIAYRSRYLTGPAPAPVFDLVLLDPDNPRSLLYQVEALADHIRALPQLMQDGLPEPPLREVRAILHRLQSLTAEDLTAEELRAVERRLLALSDAISSRYFLQYEKYGQPVQHSFLA